MNVSQRDQFSRRLIYVWVNFRKFCVFVANPRKFVSAKFAFFSNQLKLIYVKILSKPLFSLDSLSNKTWITKFRIITNYTYLINFYNLNDISTTFPLGKKCQNSHPRKQIHAKINLTKVNLPKIFHNTQRKFWLAKCNQFTQQAEFSYPLPQKIIYFFIMRCIETHQKYF